MSKINDNTTIDIEKSKELLDKVHKYFKDEPKLKSIRSNKKINNSIDEENIIEKFLILKNNEPIYEDISEYKDIDLIIKDLNSKYENLKEDIRIILKDIDCDDNTQKALRAIVNSIKNFGKNIDKLNRGISEDLDLVKNTEVFKTNLKKLLRDRIIKDCINPIYQGMKYSEDDIYNNLLIYINKWLQDLGIYTLKINQKEKLDDEKLIYIEQIHPELTKEYEKNEIIKSVIQYPYIFNEDEIICEGEVIVWRFE